MIRRNNSRILGVGTEEDRQRTEGLATEIRRINEGTISNRFRNLLSRNRQIQLTLDQVIDIDREITNFRQNRLNYIQPHNLYDQNSNLNQSRLLMHYRETQNRCVGQDVVSISLVNPESHEEIIRGNFNLTHLGLVIIGIKGLTRKDIGAKVFIALVDDRFNSEQAIVGAIEVDMNDNGGLFYCAPDYVINTRDFIKHLKVKIMTKGYETLIEGKNLLVCTSFIGKITQSSQVRFKFQIQDTVKCITNKGIKLLPPYKVDALENAGQEWQINNILNNTSRTIYTPQESMWYRNNQGRLSVRFTEYTEANNHLEEESLEEEYKENEQ